MIQQPASVSAHGEMDPSEKNGTPKQPSRLSRPPCQGALYFLPLPFQRAVCVEGIM